MTTTTAVTPIPFSTDELRELRRLGFSWDEDLGGLVHRACGELVAEHHETHHAECKYVRYLDMGYTRRGDVFLHMPHGCITDNPDDHRLRCQANFHP